MSNSSDSAVAAACTVYSVGSNLVICGGHGTCIKTSSTCKCDNGWTSRGDFELAYDANCDILIDAIKALACLLIIFAAMVFGLACYNIANFENYKAVTLHHPKSRISIVFGVASVGGIIYGCGRLAEPVANVVGGEASSSVGFVIFIIAMNSGWSILSSLFAQFLKGSARILGVEAQTRISAVSEFVERVHLWIALANVPVFVFPVVASQIPASSDTVVIAVLIFLAVLIVITAFTDIWVLYAFNHEMGLYIKSSTPPPSLVLVHFSTTILFYISTVFLGIIAPLCVIIAAVPYLRRKFSYFVMVLMINCLIPSLGVLWMQAPKKKTVSSKSAKVAVTDTPAGTTESNKPVEQP